MSGEKREGREAGVGEIYVGRRWREIEDGGGAVVEGGALVQEMEIWVD